MEQKHKELDSSSMERLLADMIEAMLRQGIQSQPPKSAPVPQNRDKKIATYMVKEARAMGKEEFISNAPERWKKTLEAISSASVALETYTRYVMRKGTETPTQDQAQHRVEILGRARSGIVEAIASALLNEAEEEKVASDIPDVRNVSEAKGLTLSCLHNLVKLAEKGQKNTEEVLVANLVTTLFRIDREVKEVSHVADKLG